MDKLSEKKHSLICTLMDTNEYLDEEIRKYIRELQDRVEKLESEKSCSEWGKDCNKRINDIELCIETLTRDFHRVGKSKSPHKCPVCEGAGSVIFHKVFDDCKSCEGKGIVWG